MAGCKIDEIGWNCELTILFTGLYLLRYDKLVSCLIKFNNSILSVNLKLYFRCRSDSCFQEGQEITNFDPSKLQTFNLPKVWAGWGLNALTGPTILSGWLCVRSPHKKSVDCFEILFYLLYTHWWLMILLRL